jgi:hypothetical protein
MSTENLVIVYVNPVSSLPVFIYGDVDTPDLVEIAELYVPEGTSYNIVHVDDIHSAALPPLQPEILDDEETDLASLFYDYLEAL